ncbi:FecR family protein [Paraflavitalea speifideaquila]|uniref:FecR family protein n=1 Tax=Paraflavitalea speifideaquila TaxID=3076558 RepID=UPI0028EFE78E|nr:FecR domain-containing protein [Paraflavitalea speifideiaquila]
MKKQLEGKISVEERQQLAMYVEQEAHKEQVIAVLAELLEQQVPDSTYDNLRFDPLLYTVLQADKPGAMVVSMRRRVYKWLAIAAVLIVIAGGGLFYWYRTQSPPAGKPLVTSLTNDALPGGDGAILTLANGKAILLDSTQTGIVEELGMKAVVRDGMLVYEVQASAAVGYHTMATPRGRQFQVVLPDGTRVWLNAASSITYPTRFVESTRPVSVTGEVYFEVAKDTAKPFVVKMKEGMEVEVLGTHFNINAYGDEGGVKTTLLEGKVKVMNRSRHAAGAIGNGDATTSTVTLQPGQQAQIINHQLSIIKKPDIDQVMAWKEGLFHFNNTRFSVVMGELERWYDVEVVYEGPVPAGSLSGEFPRTLLLSEVLRILELSGLHYSIKDKN